MKLAVHKKKSLAIIYDASLMDVPGVEFFNVDYWRVQEALHGDAVGRGSAWFIDAPQGPVVLRRYLRGGWAAKISRQAYLFSTVSRSRPFREFKLLAMLSEQGLPVPAPIAALCEFHGFVSTGTIIMSRIAHAQTLADVLRLSAGEPAHDAGVWASVGKCIRRFHDAGVWHADLNARNILLSDESNVFLIDFDRARFTPGKAVNGEGNLKRLKRSLTKLWPTDQLSRLSSSWDLLTAGYYE